MARNRYKIYEEAFPYFLTSSVSRNYPLFANPYAAEVILDGLSFLQESRHILIYGYVIMVNHIHFIAAGEALSEKLRLFKSYSGREIIRRLQEAGRTRILKTLTVNGMGTSFNHNYSIWQPGFYPKQIRSEKMMIQKLDYIHNNPVKRGYVDDPLHWRYSSARNYSGKEGLLNITKYWE